MFTRHSDPPSDVTHIRDVGLLPGEKVSHVFSPQDGLVDEPPENGRVLVTTNQRIISFSQDPTHNETFLVPIEELKGIVVKDSVRSSLSLFQGLLLVVVGAFTYLVVAYWLAGRFEGPSVPIINLDFGPLLTLMVIFWGAVLIGRYYFTREDSSATFQGSNWAFSFPFRGIKAEEEIYQVVNTMFTARRSRNGYSFLWEE